MPTLTGTLTDVAGGHLVGKAPQLTFTLNAPGVNGSTLHPTEPATVTPDSTGAFSVTLADTTAMRDTAYYNLAISWLDPAGNSIRVDYPDWRIQVPTGGGNIADAINRPPTNPRSVYVSLVEPPNPTPYMLWLKQDPTNQYNSANTGDLYEWRSV